MSNQQTVIRLNVLAKDLENAKQIHQAAKGNAYIGLMVKNFDSIAAAVARIHQYQEAGIPVSVGLGAGDPAQWRKVIDVSVQTKPVHVNQVFPAVGYTMGALSAVGSTHTMINALIRPTGTVGQVSVLTGPDSQQYGETVSCDTAAALLAELGVQSVKFYPIDGDKRLDELAAMVQAAVKRNITIFEPTGGIDGRNVFNVVKTCVDNGAKTVIPHIYTAFVDQATGLTSAEQVAQLLQDLSKS